MHFDCCKIHREVQKHPGNDHLTSPLHPRRFLVPYLEIDERGLNFILKLKRINAKQQSGFFLLFYIFYIQIMLITLTFGSLNKTEVQGEESASKHHGEDDSRGPEVRDVET